MFNYITVEFPGSEVPPQQVFKFTLVQSRYTHEVASIEFRDWNPQYSSLKPLSPIRCLLRSSDGVKEFTGYVHSIIPNISPGKNFAEIIMVGATYLLNQAHQRVFENVSADKVVEKIATENNFSFFAEPHPRVYDQVAQAGHTNLELLTRLALQCGYSLRMDNTSINFRPLMFDYTKSRATTAKFIMREANDPAGSTLYSFTAAVGESNDYEGIVKSKVSVGGMHRDDEGAAYTYTSSRPASTSRNIVQSALFDSFATMVVAPTPEIAQSESVAAEQLMRFPYRGTVVVIGSPSMRPDLPVYLDGIGSEYSGFWMVLSTKHIVIEEKRNVYKYVTVLEVGTDSLGTAVLWEDNQVVSVPSDISVRPLTVGVRTGNIVETAKLTNVAVSPNPTVASLFSSANRPIVKEQATNYPKFRKPIWSSNVGNLREGQVISRRSKVITDRLINNGTI